MALSGQITSTYTNNSAFTAILNWSGVQNIAANTTTITATLTIRSNYSWAVGSNWNGVNATITINGNSASSAINHSIAGGASKVVYTRTHTVTHASDGSFSNFNIGYSISFGDVYWNSGYIGSTSNSGTTSLNTIPRASSIGTITGGTIGSPITVNISRAVSSFTHKVWLYLPNGSYREVATGAGTSATFTPPLSDCANLPNSTSYQAKIEIGTYSGTTLIGGYVSKTITLSVPASVEPTITGFTVADATNNASTAGLAAKNFVEGRSTLRFSGAASGAQGSTIKTYAFTYNGATKSGTTAQDFATGGAASSGTAILIVTDSRGRTATSTMTGIVIHAYFAPRISSFWVSRKNNGNTLEAQINVAVASLGGKNKIQGYVSNNTGFSAFIDEASTSSKSSYDGTVQVQGTYDITTSHTIQLDLYDKFQKTSSASSVSTAKVLLDLNEDSGVGVGKIHERGTLDVGGTSYFEHINSTGSVSVKYLTVGESMEVRSGASFLGAIDAPNIGHQNGARAGDANTLNYWHLYPNGRTSWFVYPGTNAVNFPATYCFVDLIKQGGEFSAIIYEQSSGKIWRKSGNGVGISDWVETMQAIDLFFSKNENGETWRWSHGLQICYHEKWTKDTVNTKDGCNYRSSNNIWTFPTAFKYPPVVSVHPAQGTGYSWGGLGEDATSPNRTSFVCYSGSVRNTGALMDLKAIGWWF